MKKERRASQQAFLSMYSSKVWFITKKSNNMEIKRNIHLNRIIARKGNGMIKVVPQEPFYSYLYPWHQGTIWNKERWRFGRANQLGRLKYWQPNQSNKVGKLLQICQTKQSFKRYHQELSRLDARCFYHREIYQIWHQRQEIHWHTSKYYFTDLGLRNARLNFRQTEFTHLLENAIYNELRIRGYSVDVGQIPIFTIGEDGKRQRSTLEVDFVCNLGYKRCYIQSAYALPTEDKMKQEFNSLLRIKDSFKKIVIVGTPTPTYQNEEGILTMNIYDFLMNPDSLNI